jgi:uncharacterized protein (TIGR03382 family)
MKRPNTRALWYVSRMRSLAIVLTLGAGVAVASLSVPTRADIPPPRSSPDAHCTPREQCEAGVFCPYAFRPSSVDGEDAKVGADCRAQASAAGLEKRCHDGGNYSGQALFCPPGATGKWRGSRAAAAGQPPRAGNCSVHGDGPSGTLLLLGLLGLWSRRRRHA